MEHDLEKLAVTALPISASPIMRHDFCIESWKHCEQTKSGLFAFMVASVDKGIHNKTTKYGLPTY